MIKLLLDENIAKNTQTHFKALGYDVVSVADLKMLGCEDVDVLRRATMEDRIVITHDLDFGNLVRFPVFYTGVIILRLDDQTPNNTNKILQAFLKQVDQQVLLTSLVIVSEDKYRIRLLK